MDTFKRYLPVLLLVLIFGAAFQLPNSVPGQLKAIQSQLSGLEFDITGLQSEISRLKPRKFYLTRDRYDGAQALTACAGGYHMASSYEILDPTDLRYNTELGLTLGDSGFGPPSSYFGWIRSGENTDHDLNCSAWTSARSGDHGPIAQLFTGLWHIQNTNCSLTLQVWCVQD